MAHGQPIQIVEVSASGKLIFHRELLDTVVTQCGDFPLAVYTLAGEFRKGKTTLLNIFLAFNHFYELGQNWKQHKEYHLTGFEARGGSIKVTNGIWVWSKPFFSTDQAGNKVAIMIMDTQGTFDQETPSAVNSFIFGFSLSVSSILMYNNMTHISSHDVDSLITFGMTFLPIVGKFQTLSFLVRDWDDEERFQYGWEGGDMMITDLLNPGASVDTELREARKSIKNMYESVIGFLLPPPGDKVERAKRAKLSIGDMDDNFLKYVDDLCREIFVRNVKPFKYKGKEMNGNDWLTIFDHLIKAYHEGKIMDPGFHQDAFTGSSAKTIKDEIVANYQKEMSRKIMAEMSKSGLTYVTESFLNEIDSVAREKAMKSFVEKTAHFGKQDAIGTQIVKRVSKYQIVAYYQNDSYLNATHPSIRHDNVKFFRERTHFENQDAIGVQMMREVSKWFIDRKQENARAMTNRKEVLETQRRLLVEQEKHKKEQKRLANQLNQIKYNSKAQIERQMWMSRIEMDQIQRRANKRIAELNEHMYCNNCDNLKRVFREIRQERSDIDFREYQLAIENTPYDDRHVLTDWPIPGFVYEIDESSDTLVPDLTNVSNEVFKIVKICLDTNQPHNILITRCCARKNIVRIVLWPREPQFGLKNDMELAAALCEFSGFFICKTKSDYENISEQVCIDLMKSLDTRIDEILLQLDR